MLEFTVKRSEWLRGEGSADSYLLRNSDKKMCCLGFCSLALGYTKEDILMRLAPRSIDNKKLFPETFFSIRDEEYYHDKYYHSDDTISIISVNDNRSISDQEREALLTELFLKLNIKVTFVD